MIIVDMMEVGITFLYAALGILVGNMILTEITNLIDICIRGKDNGENL